jgi:xanthine dehydrogenase YagS FAD-binding subunit
MQPIRYQRVDSAQAAVEAATAQRGTFVAGGTSLIDVMKLGVVNPELLIDINRLPLGQIENTPQGVRIGALVRNSDLAVHPLIEKQYPLLSESLLSGASPQIRNMATVGGNLLQRTRCYYFRDTGSPCNKREPMSGCSALEGQQRIHAILGTSDRCIATHPSDLCVALCALDAVVHTRGPRGERTIPIAEFHVVPGDRPERESVLEPGELVVAVLLPPRAGYAQSRYIKVRDRASFAFALASAAAVLRLDPQGIIREARIALGGVATKPWRSPEAEAVLLGQRPERTLFEKAATAALAAAKPRAHNAFKVALCKRTLVRALESVEVKR